MGRRRRAYLDTVVLISLILGDRYTKYMQKALYNLLRWDYDIVVTQVAVGEALAILMKRYRDPREIDEHIHTMIGLLKKHRISVEDCVVPVTGRTVDIAARLRGMDSRIVGNDLIIVARALADPDSAVLVTTDGVLLDNKAIDRLEAELRADGGGRNLRMKVVSRST